MSRQELVTVLHKLAEEGEAAYARGEYTRLSTREDLCAFIRESSVRWMKSSFRNGLVAERPARHDPPSLAEV
jgi:hypothetical protein